MDSLRIEGLKLVEECCEVYLASVTEEGYPRVCVLSKLAQEGNFGFLCATGTSGTKTRHFSKNSKASACFHKDADSITLVGTMEIVKDMAQKQAAWQEWMRAHFPKGMEDPEYCLLRFRADEATLWIGGRFRTISLARYQKGTETDV